MPITVTNTPTIADAYIESIGSDSIIQIEAPGGVWNEQIEQGTPGRAIVYRFSPGETVVMEINGTIIYEELRYLVTMVGENDRFEDLRAGDTRIKQLLHRERGDSVNEADVTLGKVLWCLYKAPHKELVPVGDQRYPELGGFYKIAVQPPISV